MTSTLNRTEELFANMLRRHLGHEPDGEIIPGDIHGHAIIHYATVEEVEHGTADERFGVRTWHQYEEVEDTAEATNLNELLTTCKELDHREATIILIELPDNIADELHATTTAA